MREGVATDERLRRRRRTVQQLVDGVRDAREADEPALGQRAAVERDLKSADDRREVGVAGALADAVHRALHLRGAGLDGGDRVRDAALQSLWQ